MPGRPLPGRVAATATLTPPPADARAESRERDQARPEPTPGLTGQDSAAETRLNHQSDSLTDSAIRRADSPQSGSGQRSSSNDSHVGPLAPGEPFGVRYRVLSVLGAGGMGCYKAWDDRARRRGRDQDGTPEDRRRSGTARLLDRRFKQELLLARKVTHKNIVRVHDIGELDGMKYITMPYLQGEDLASVLKREGKLPVERVLKLARSVISGLAAAHDAGVVHRDLKPANIMVAPDGEGLVMDFGVARSTETPIADRRRDPSSDTLATLPAHGTHVPPEQTASGMVVGTMSTWRPSSRAARPWTSAPTSTPSG